MKNILIAKNKGAEFFLRIEGNNVYLGSQENDTFFGSECPENCEPTQTIQQFIDLGWLGWGDEVDWDGERFYIVSSYENRIIDIDCNTVGFYYPESAISQTVGAIHLSTDYTGVSHAKIIELLGVVGVKSVNTSLNNNWILSYDESKEMATYPVQLPVAEALITHYTATDVCEIFGITRRTLGNWINKGRVHPIKKGEKLFFPKGQIDKLR